MLREFRGAAHRLFGHRLSERDGGGLDRLVADGAVGRAADFVEALLGPGKIVSLSAADAAGVSGIAVELDDVLGCETRSLMQIVDVLGNDGRNLAGPVERGQRAVATSRLCRGECRFHREAPPPCLVPGVRTGDKLVEWNRTVAGP